MGLAKKIFKQEAEDFPKSACKWIKDKGIDWEKRKVPASEIDFSNVKKWRATKDTGRVKTFIKLITDEGYNKRALLVKVPGKDKLIVVDGHHRVLAWRKLKKKIRAYVGTTATVNGPWDEMHTAQNRALLTLMTYWRKLHLAS